MQLSLFLFISSFNSWHNTFRWYLTDICNKKCTIASYCLTSKDKTSDGYISVLLSLSSDKIIKWITKEVPFPFGENLSADKKSKAALYQIHWDPEIRLTYMSLKLVPQNVILKVMSHSDQAEFPNSRTWAETAYWDLTWQPCSSYWDTA